jgi:cytochrome P450
VPGKIASQIYALPAPGVVTIEEAQLLVRTLLAAGFDTTVLALSSAFYWLSRNPSQWPLLRDQAARKRAFEETIRIEPPARFLARVATGHMEIAGQSFEPGDHVVLSLTAAGRDPRRWSEPDQYDIERKPASHMSFGAGIHTCIGQALARMEFEALFSALARRFATIEPAGNAVRFENNAANGWKSVPIRFVPA